MNKRAQRFRKKPVEIEAIQFVRDKSRSRTNLADIAVFIGSPYGERFIVRPPYAIGILTLEGTMWAQPGDWIIRGVKDEFYPCKPDIFEITYEPVVPGEAADTTRTLLAENERLARLVEDLPEQFAARIATLEGLIDEARARLLVGRAWASWQKHYDAYWASVKDAANGVEAVLLEAQEGEVET